MNTARKVLSLLYVAIIVCMATATIAEKNHGTDYAHAHYYGAWWFILLWAVVAALGVFYIVKRKVKAASTLLLHLSFVIILAGALLTHVSAKRGMVHLRIGEPTDSYVTDGGGALQKEEKLPFTLCLRKFEMKMHDGTNAVADYISVFQVTDKSGVSTASVSMNNIYSTHNYRFYQSSFDEDGKGSVLAINADPYGIPATYTGYALLFISLVWMLFDPKGGYRKVLQDPLFRKGTLVLAFLFAAGTGAFAHSYDDGIARSVLPKATAERFGRLNILYNDRICPLQTFALDFCKKVYGARSYKGLTAEQVVSGWIFYGEEWSKEPFIKVKGGELRDALQLDGHCSLDRFFNKTLGGYIIGPYVQEYYSGNQDKFHKQVAAVDDKIQLIMDLRRGVSLKVLPYTFPSNVKATAGFPFVKAGTTVWYSPTDRLHPAVEQQHALYINNVFSLLNEDVKAGNTDRVNVFFDKMKRYQEVSAGASLPSPTRIKAERIYNAYPFATVLFMVNLTLGFIALLYTVYRITRQRRIRLLDVALPVLLLLSFIALTLGIALRWIVSGNVPMANGYESMLTVAWLVMLISLCLQFRIRIVLVFGFLLSGFFLLVSHINQMDPAIGQMMPVLNSPLLSLHVSIIMMSYALLSLTFICGVTGLCLNRHSAELQTLSRFFLYPALTTLGFGIFIGAIWANVSWGTYWSWDSKETWALITFMIYAIPMHRQSLQWLRTPRNYHIYCTLAFLTVLMTYFGVNYFLQGMHSYA